MLRLFGPNWSTGQYVVHSWTWLCPLSITAALAMDLISIKNEQSKRAEGLLLWHLIPIGSVLPLLSVFYYAKVVHTILKRLNALSFQDKNAFDPKRWRELRIPTDDESTTNCNTVLISQPAELKTIGAAASRPSIDFVLSDSPYFDASDCLFETISEEPELDIVSPTNENRITYNSFSELTGQPSFV